MPPVLEIQPVAMSHCQSNYSMISTCNISNNLWLSTRASGGEADTEYSSMISMLTRVVREKDKVIKQMSLSQANSLLGQWVCASYRMPLPTKWIICVCIHLLLSEEQSSIHPGICCSIFQPVSCPPVSSWSVWWGPPEADEVRPTSRQVGQPPCTARHVQQKSGIWCILGPSQQAWNGTELQLCPGANWIPTHEFS